MSIVRTTLINTSIIKTSIVKTIIIGDGEGPNIPPASIPLKAWSGDPYCAFLNVTHEGVQVTYNGEDVLYTSF